MRILDQRCSVTAPKGKSTQVDQEKLIHGCFDTFLGGVSGPRAVRTCYERRVVFPSLQGTVVQENFCIVEPKLQQPLDSGIDEKRRGPSARAD